MQPLVLGWLKTFLIYDMMLANGMIYNDTIYTYKWLEYLLCSLRKSFIRLQHITIFETVQTSSSKMVSNQAAEYDY